MAVVAQKAEWAKVLLGKKDCVVVKHPTKPHVRRYKRDVKNGIPMMEALIKAHYMRRGEWL